MAEIEKLKVADKAYKAFKNLDRRIGGYLKNLNTRFGDEEDVDEAGEENLGADADADEN